MPLIQSYVGPDHKVLDMRSFFGALVAALRAAHELGQKGSRVTIAAGASLRKTQSQQAGHLVDIG